jgi:hypothetical protein
MNIFRGPSSRFLAIVVCGDIFRLMALVLGANRLLVMTKDTNGFRLIVIGEVFLQLFNRSIVL